MKFEEINTRYYLKWRMGEMGVALRAMRQSQGVSQQMVANWLGCSRSRIARIENGYDQSGYTLEEIELLALRLGTNPYELTTPSPTALFMLQAAFTNEWGHQALEQPIFCHLPTGLTVPDNPHIAISPDNMLVASCLQSASSINNNFVVIWEGDTGGIKHQIPLSGSETAVTFSPDSKLLAVGTDMDAVMVLNCENGQVCACLDPVEDVYSDELWRYVNEAGYGIITQVCFSPNGKFLVAVNEEHGTLRIWETRTWHVLTTWNLHSVYPSSDRFEMADAKEVSPFSDFSVSQLAFTPDSQFLVVSPLWRESVAVFSVPKGKCVWQFTFPDSVDSFDISFPFGPEAEMVLAFGGRNDYWEMIKVDSRFGVKQHTHTNYTISPPDRGRLFNTIEQIVVLDSHCILAIKKRNWLKSDNATNQPCWSIVNLVTYQEVILANRSNRDTTIHIALDGSRLVFVDGKQQQVGIQPLRLEYLRPEKGQQGIQSMTQEGRWPGGLLRGTEQGEEWADEDADENEGVFDMTMMPFVPISFPLHHTIDHLKNRFCYGAAQLPTKDLSTMPRIIDLIKQETYDIPILIDLPQRVAEVDLRALLGLLVGRPLLRGERTGDCIDELKEKRPYTLIFVDSAERLHPDAISWISNSGRTITDVFVLIARDWGKFMGTLEKCQEGGEKMFEKMIQVDLGKWLE